MPDNQTDVIQKKYFTIGEVARDLNITTSQIRFWENEFDIINPQKNKNGKRQFTAEDIKQIRLVYHLVKEKGMTLNGAKSVIKNDGKSARDKLEMIDSLKKVRSFLVELRDQLDDAEENQSPQ